MKLLNWFKKNTFYKVLVIAVVLALAGYAAWFFQPMPLIPEGAENIRIDYTTFSSTGVEPTEVQIIFSKWADSYEYETTHLIDLTEEGCQKLIELLKAQKTRAMWSSTGSYQGRSEGRLSFAVKYEYKGVAYARWICTEKEIEVSTGWHVIEEGATPGLKPSSRHNTKITGQQEADAFFSDALNIIENYAATDRIVTPQ